MKKLIDSIIDNLEAGRTLVLVNVIASNGSTPRGAGASMLVYEDGHCLGTIGGGTVEYEAQKQAHGIFQDKKSKMASYSLLPNDLGMICGGNVTLYFQFIQPKSSDAEFFAYLKSAFEKQESIWLLRRFQNDLMTGIGAYDNSGLHYMSPAPDIDIKPYLTSKTEMITGKVSYFIEPLKLTGKVYIFGGGHVAQALVPVLSHVDFEAIVFDDRADFAQRTLFNGVTDVILGDFARFTDFIAIEPEDYIVIMTRGHQFDYEVLRQALGTKASYVGCIGSKRKMEVIKRRILDDGIEEAALERIHSPIGLEIKAETPAEIAISITAELILFRANKANT